MGGILQRLRVPNALKMSNGRALKKATGQNPNPFYYTEVTPDPIISGKAQVTTPELKKTLLYDLPAQKGQVYTLVAL